MKKTILVYHYWATQPVQVWKASRSPIIFAIATVRAWDKTTPVYVIDNTPHNTDWGEYPRKLGFSVVQDKGYFSRLNLDLTTPPGFPPNSHNPYFVQKTFDITLLAERMKAERVVYLDSDIFWLGPVSDVLIDDPRLSCCYFPSNPRINSGFYFYDVGAKQATAFLHAWQHTLLRAALDVQFAAHVTSYLREIIPVTGSYAITDETCMMYTEHWSKTIRPIPPEQVQVVTTGTANLVARNGIHMMQNAFDTPSAVRRPENKCLFAVEMGELHQVLRKSLSEDEIDSAFADPKSVRKSAFRLADFSYWAEGVKPRVSVPIL